MQQHPRSNQQGWSPLPDRAPVPARRAHFPDTWFRVLVEQPLAGIYVIQGERFLYVNTRLAELFGYTVEQILNSRTVGDLVAQEHRAVVLDNVRRRLAGEVESIRYHFQGRRRDGTVIEVEAHGARSELAGEPVVIGLLLDVTDRKRAEEERVALLRETQEAVRARDEVLAVVSHDLRNPLNAVVMTTDFLLMQEEDADKLRMLQRMKRLTGRMEVLIRDLLDASSTQAGRLSVARGPESVATLLDEVVEMLTPQAEERGVRLEVEAADAEVEVDFDRMVQALCNLAGNALKFTPEGGTVALRAVAEAGTVRFSVEDNGCGIPEEHLERLFEPFWRGSGGEGAGLGLAIAKGIVQAHGSDIGVESEVGRGTRMEFSLPLHRRAAPARD